MRTIRFRNDKEMRDKLYVPAAYVHPAKGNLYMWLGMIERYTQPGDTVLDPMSGVGATLLAALLGRRVVCLELEQHFLEPMRASWQRMRQHPMLGYSLGEVLILRGDARAMPIASADAVITSPPYEGSVTSERNGIDWARQADGRKKQEPHGVGAHPFSYTRPAAIITSPPYEEHHQGGEDPHPEKAWPSGRDSATTADRYTRPAAIITSPPYDADSGRSQNKSRAEQGTGRGRGYTRPDCILTSPPYQQSLGSGGNKPTPHDTSGWYNRDYDAKVPYNLRGALMINAGVYDRWKATTNIGNLRNNAYWEAMSLVYQECLRVLRPGGLMALVLKGYTRDGQYVDLPGQTAELVQSLGFLPHDHWRRELWALSFWRILQRRRAPEAFDDRLNFEEVLCFRKAA